MTVKENRPNWFSETEKLLDLYWQRQLQIERVNARLSSVQAELAALEMELREGRRWPKVVAKYGTAPVAKNNRNTGLDETLTQWEEDLDKAARRIAGKRKAYLRLKARLARLLRQQAPMDVMLKRLKPEERRLLECRYVYRWSNSAIAREMNYTEGNIRYMHRQIVYRVAEWLGKR